MDASEQSTPPFVDAMLRLWLARKMSFAAWRLSEIVKSASDQGRSRQAVKPGNPILHWVELLHGFDLL